MKLVVGGSYQGKNRWVKEHYGAETFAYALKCGREELFSASAVSGIHLLVREMLFGAEGEQKPEQREERAVERFFEELLERNPGVVLTGDEVGLGIVPADAFERRYREAVGRLYGSLAKRAEEVVRVSLGCGTVLKKEKKLAVTFIRHGQTRGNLEGRYVGTTDEELTSDGREALERNCLEGWYPAVDRVFMSPLLRCMQTAALIYPGAVKTIVPDLAECGFGEFEYKNYQELNGNPDYQAFIDSGGRTAFPGGETREDFSRRSSEAFLHIVEEARKLGLNKIAVIAHGGTIMAVLERFAVPSEDYFHWQVKNGCGYEAEAVWTERGFGLLVSQRLDGAEDPVTAG